MTGRPEHRTLGEVARVVIDFSFGTCARVLIGRASCVAIFSSQNMACACARIGHYYYVTRKTKKDKKQEVISFLPFLSFSPL